MDTTAGNLYKDHPRPLSVVFGGGGFIGHHLALELFSQGHEVIVCDLKFESKSSSLRYEICDVSQPIAIKVERKPKYVFNLAAVHRTPGHKDSEYFATNIAGALHITDWCSTHDVEELFFTSSISVYGLSVGSKDERSPLQPITPYGFSKKFAEEIQIRWQSEKPEIRKLSICRPAVIFGPGEKGNFTRLATALRRNLFFFPDGPKTIKACGYISDLISSILFVLEKRDRIIIYNFAYPEVTTIGDICRAFSKVSDFRFPISIPGRLISKVLLHLRGPFRAIGIRIEKLIFPTDILPLYLIENGFKWHTNIDSAVKLWFDNNRVDGVFRDSRKD